jgi:glycosyltransferase involved in cell wall biosynthesis
MNIIQIISSLGNGGAEKFVVELSNEQSKKHEVTLVSFRNITDDMFPPKRLNTKVKLISLDKKEGFDYSIVPKLFRLFCSLKPDVVHCHLDSTVQYVYIVTFFYKKCKYLQTIHCKLDTDKKRVFNNFRRFPFFSQKFTNVCISKTIFQEFSASYPKFKFVHIDNGINKMEPSREIQNINIEVDKLRKNKEKIFIAIGRFSYEKNFPMLARVFKRLDENNYNVILIIIGGDPIKEKNEIEHVNKIKSNNTYLLGQRSNIADYLLNADALVMSSRFEGMPITVLEAMSIGLPVISTPAGGVVDLIKNGINGFIADSIEENDFFVSMKMFLDSNDKLIKTIRENNLTYFKSNLTISLCAERYENVYKNYG